MEELLKDLVAVSREYGSDPKWVVAGGGNTSLKSGDTLYVKASGFPLATIDENGFARMDRRKLAAIWDRNYPKGEDTDSVAERERRVLEDVMAAREPGESRRPSVETLLHDILPWPLVVHLHPTLVNGLTCGADGEEIAAEIFGDSQVWIPYVDPGYVLSKTIRDALDGRKSQGLNSPDYIFLANHGVFVGGKGKQEIHGKYSRLSEKLSTHLVRVPGAMPVERSFPGDWSALVSAATECLGKGTEGKYVSGGELDRYLENSDTAATLRGSLTPDHIVYSGPGAMYLNTEELEDSGLVKAWLRSAERYHEIWGKYPGITLLNDGKKIRGAFIVAVGGKALTNAEILFHNALEVSAYSESFGGPHLMDDNQTRFIVNWEAESYRKEQI